MIEKMIGTLLVIPGSIALGIYYGWELKQRLEELIKVRQIMELLKRQIQYTKAPLEECLVEISGKTTGIYKNWLLKTAKRIEAGEDENLYRIWKESVYKELAGTLLRKQDVEALAEVGRSIDALDCDSVLAGITLYQEELEETIRRMRSENKEKRKLCHCLGVIGGIFIVAVLI